MTTATTTTTGYSDLPRLMRLMTGAEKHQPSATSTLDVLWVLYDRILRVAPETADDPDRDRLVLSKGHGPMAPRKMRVVQLADSRRPPVARHEPVSLAVELKKEPGRIHALEPDTRIACGKCGHRGRLLSADPRCRCGLL